MRAIIQKVYGLPDGLEVRETGTPIPDDGQVLIRVVAPSLNTEVQGAAVDSVPGALN